MHHTVSEWLSRLLFKEVKSRVTLSNFITSLIKNTEFTYNFDVHKSWRNLTQGTQFDDYQYLLLIYGDT